MLFFNWYSFHEYLVILYDCFIKRFMWMKYTNNSVKCLPSIWYLADAWQLTSSADKQTSRIWWLFDTLLAKWLPGICKASATHFASNYQALDSQHQVLVKHLSELVVYEKNDRSFPIYQWFHVLFLIVGLALKFPRLLILEKSYEINLEEKYK